jgi:hypothetical protein
LGFEEHDSMIMLNSFSIASELANEITPRFEDEMKHLKKPKEAAQQG